MIERGARRAPRRRAARRYMVDLAEASRRHPALLLGLSPRATLQLPRAARARAASPGPRLRHARRREGGGRAGAGPPPHAARRARRPASADDAVGEMLADVPVPVAR